jgi:hypothetical protein
MLVLKREVQHKSWGQKLLRADKRIPYDCKKITPRETNVGGPGKNIV